MASILEILTDLALRQSHPIYASIELTYRCNLACRYCYNPVERKNQPGRDEKKHLSQQELSTEEVISVLDQLKDMNVLYLTLTGGEPLLRDDFWEIVEAAKGRSFAIRLFTNGILIDDTIADRISDLAPYCVEISVHGASNESASRTTQVKDSFSKQMRAIQLLKERGVRLYLKCVVTSILEDELREIQAIGDKFGVPLYFDPVLTVSDDGLDYPLQFIASDEALKILYSDPAFLTGVSPFDQEPGEFNCTVGSGVIAIGPFGDVQPCIQWKQSLGNVRDTTIAEMWANSPLLKKVRDINKNLPRILGAEKKDGGYCFSCPGLSQLRNGDPYKPDEQYRRIRRIREALKESTGKENE